MDGHTVPFPECPFPAQRSICFGIFGVFCTSRASLHYAHCALCNVHAIFGTYFPTPHIPDCFEDAKVNPTHPLITDGVGVRSSPLFWTSQAISPI